MMRGGFTQLPNAVLYGEVTTRSGKPLTSSARILYGLILDRSNRGTRLCTASEAYFGRYVGVGERQVRNLLAELRDASLIEVHREGRGVTNTIRPLLVPDRPDRKLTSAHHRNSASAEQEPQQTNNGNGSKGNQSGGSSRQRAGT